MAAAGFTFTVSTDIAASPARVWRALCDPAQVVAWDSGVAHALDASSDYPRPGQHVRWRYRTGPFRILHDRPQEVVPERTLRALLALGPFRFDETYTLGGAGGACRLTAAMLVSSVIPLVGRMIVRRRVGPQTRAAMEGSLAAIKRHCEAAR
jgi:Polyketide cyclase / dehydrase and lipid transport